MPQFVPWQATWVRPGTLGFHDVEIVEDIRVRDAYRLRQWNDPVPRRILDIGAHLGSFSCLAHDLWPEAEIVCVEPNPDMHAVLRENVGAFALIEQVGIGHTCGSALFVKTPQPGSSHVSDAGTETVELLTFRELLVRIGWEFVDLLKVDCEGCEWFVLPDTDGVQCICGELHTTTTHGWEHWESLVRVHGFSEVDIWPNTNSPDVLGLFWARRTTRSQ